MAEEILYGSDRTRSRDAIGAYLDRLADAVAAGGRVPVDEDGAVTIDPPDRAGFEIELERQDGTLALELEVEWPERAGDVEGPGTAAAPEDRSSGGDDRAIASDAEAVESADAGGGASDATFELFADNAGEWRWRLRHDNGNIIADSGEGYASKQKARQGLESVRRNAPGAGTETAE